MGLETDQGAVMIGLMLHTNAKQLIKAQNYQDALEVLSMGEEAFSLCDQKLLSKSTNPSILQVDMVWCYFMLRDINCLSVAGIRLEKAREGLERAHGKDSSRVKTPSAAGRVVACHSGQVDKSMKVLTSAQEKFTQLQVLNETLSLMMSMGFRERDAKRFEKELAAEALRRNVNDSEKALDLTNPETNSSIQQHLESRKSKRHRRAVDASVEALVRMGFDRSFAIEALRGGGTMDQIICRLLSGQAPNPTNAANQSEAIPAVDANNNSQSDVATDIANSLASMLDNQNGQVGGPSTSSNASERDAEMESQLAEELAPGDVNYTWLY